ncbi:MAG: MBL fold metallo-hydrolase [Dysgonamonadaceae bacterium]|jgi:glyoxylase-like metal-dependent hydrolase (beta-lactamase superfamily II)|nr:MBL fold metallo-hydrolase [Dysgonamonadaceae bacterium]
MWQYKILASGFFYADGGAMFGAIPKRAWSRKYPPEADNTCVLAMNCLLVWNDRQVILLDTGVGSKALGKLSYYRFHDVQAIDGLVRAQGFEPEQVTDVVLSHLHFDHCGGCTSRDAGGRIQITFPNARHWVSWPQWENYIQPNALEKASFRPDDLLPVFESGLLQLIGEDAYELAAGFQLSVYEGHTTGQLVASFDTEEGTGIFAGDVIPTRAHLPDDWISAYDTHPLESLEAKIRLKKQMQAQPSRLFLYHDAYDSSIQYLFK